MIEELLSQNEGKTLEFKENSKSLSSILKTIVAFANTSGGIVVVGVEDRTKKIIGIDRALEEEERLTNTITDSITPLIIPDIDIISYKNKQLILLHVPHSAGPYYIKSNGLEKGVYLRFGSTNRLADEEALRSLKDYARNISFDEKPFVEGTPKDLDWETIQKIFKSVQRTITPQNAKKLSLVVRHNNKDHPSNGGIILFGKERLHYFPDAMIRCARFLGTSKVTLLDQLDIEDYLPLAIDKALNFVRRNTTMGAEIKSMLRKDIPQYPIVAIREALLNAIIHTDYAMKGAPIRIAIFSDRLEITNPGRLMYGLTLPKAVGGVSKIRNRVIGRVFRELKFVEQWGTGIRRRVEACTKRGLQPPHFEELSSAFRVTFYAGQVAQPHLTELQKKFLAHLKKQGTITTKEAALFWNVTPRTARKRLVELIELGMIAKKGTSIHDPQSVYVLVQDIS